LRLQTPLTKRGGTIYIPFIISSLHILCVGELDNAQDADLQELRSMLAEITELLGSPAKYLEAAQTAEPTSGRELYERYDNLSARLIEDFPLLSIKLKPYIPDRIGSLIRADLACLSAEIRELIARIEPLAAHELTPI
jgi:hypothetical protein